MKTLWNLTQHDMTEDQVNDFENMVNDAVQIINISGDNEKIKRLLTFDDIPSTEEMEKRADELIDNVCCGDENYALIGGAPYFMSTLERVLKHYDITPIYSFSKRQSIEEHLADGSVVKRNVFKHTGYIKV